MAYRDERGRLKRIVDAVRRKPGPTPRKALGEGYSLEELVSIARRKSVTLQERIPRNEVLMLRNEVLYRLDPLIWAGVNKISRLVSSEKIFFTGSNEEDTTIMEMFIDRIKLRSILPFMIKDIFIYGYGVAEIIREVNKIVRLAQIDPKEFDYQRQEGSDYILRNSDGSIKGYRQKVTGQEDKKFKPEDVIIIKFYVLGEECLGLTPLEAVFKSSWIKINLEESLGEAVYRHGYPIYWYKLGSIEADAKGFEVTPEKVKEAKKYLHDLASANELVIPWWVTPGRLDAKSEIKGVSDFLQFLSAEILAGLEVPKVYGTTTESVQSNVSQETLDFEKTIRTMQGILVNQLDEQLFASFRKEIKMEYPYPQLKFTEHSEETKMFKARRLAQYAKYNFITPDEAIENDLRKIENLSLKGKVKRKDACVFGMGSCPVRQTVKVSLESLAKFCSNCSKKKNRETEEVIPEIVEEEEEVEEEGINA